MESEFCRSNKGIFLVQILSDNKPIYIIESRDKKNYICAESGQSFIVRMKQRKNPPKSVYGVKLFIDGKEVNRIKTFKNTSHIFGFKMGNGNYKKFLFDIPPLKDDSKTNEDLRIDNKDFGTIKLMFYATEKVVSKRKRKVGSAYSSYNQSLREEDVKFYERALAVKEGEVFQIDKKLFQRDLDVSRDYFIDDYIIDYSKLIDEIVIHYTDFYALQIKGIISLRNKDHLQYIPTSILLKEEYLIETLSTILKHHNKLHYNLIEEEFTKFTRRILCDLFSYSHITNLIQSYNLNFKIDDDGMVSLTNKEEICRKLQTFELPIKPNNKYYEKGYRSQSPSHSNISTNYRSDSGPNTKSNSRNRKQKNMIIDDFHEFSDVIILDDDEF